jgi:hypothetical protein
VPGTGLHPGNLVSDVGNGKEGLPGEKGRPGRSFVPGLIFAEVIKLTLSRGKVRKAIVKLKWHVLNIITPYFCVRSINLLNVNI